MKLKRRTMHAHDVTLDTFAAVLNPILDMEFEENEAVSKLNEDEKIGQAITLMIILMQYWSNNRALLCLIGKKWRNESNQMILKINI